MPVTFTQGPARKDATEFPSSPAGSLTIPTQPNVQGLCAEGAAEVAFAFATLRITLRVAEPAGLAGHLRKQMA